MAEEARIGPSDPRPTTLTANGSLKPQVADISGFTMPRELMSPGMAPILNPEYNENGAGIYAIQCLPYMSPLAGFSPKTLIPLKYNIPTRQSAGGTTNEHGQEAAHQHGVQRQPVVRRVLVAFQLDLGLIIKLAAMVFLFSQDGSPQNFVLLIFFASFVYLYQTGALAPFIRWFQQAGAPRRHHAPLVQQNGQPVVRDLHNNPQPVAGANNQDQPTQNPEQVDDNQNPPQPEPPGNKYWRLVKEIQVFVVGFLTSLLPGHHNND
ncbi:uncharacterized protein LOC121998679 isoform X1 [Zingiber officinale]|uniref:uncharacterized protein LOC121998679 isoform X1 n=1 Tax=Zingiber officinale TaxID=94328 RepID=UPI001C4CDAEF|nr:uncharacterized protein LOC121998679 isoform X1 [Zingiber officinale]XP_042409626.1 uncharacterized protein LOC121998679 isoform X1 [Zingiber officinale]XP_042409627.1 uncharacterized protein LOC121998679 isoform X1 [Zingiber officinale]